MGHLCKSIGLQNQSPITVHNHLSRELPSLLKFMKKNEKNVFLTVVFPKTYSAY